MTIKKLPTYFVAQFLGAFLAGLVLYLIFNPSIVVVENTRQIMRGTTESMEIAKMFGEYYQLPSSTVAVSMLLAMLAEGFGTFLLVLMIFYLTEGCNLGRPG
jgi:glycerol uptake facilitator protein